MLRYFVALLLCVTSLESASAQSAEDFYRHNSITLLVGSEAGGALSAYATIVSQYLRKYLPGEPTTIVRYMPGAGGIVAAVNFANVAAKDGSVIPLNVSQRTRPSPTRSLGNMATSSTSSKLSTVLTNSSMRSGERTAPDRLLTLAFISAFVAGFRREPL